jgi:cytidyltransferase-like protein
MGGTFDPIHHGHLVAASEVQAWFDLDEVVFVPTGRPYQKSDREISPAEHRYLMTVIATAAMTTDGRTTSDMRASLPGGVSGRDRPR